MCPELDYILEIPVQFFTQLDVTRHLNNECKVPRCHHHRPYEELFSNHNSFNRKSISLTHGNPGQELQRAPWDPVNWPSTLLELFEAGLWEGEVHCPISRPPLAKEKQTFFTKTVY